MAGGFKPPSSTQSPNSDQPCRRSGCRVLIAAAVLFLHNQVARLSGKLLKGGEPDINTAAKMVLQDWQRGKIPYFEPPPELPGPNPNAVANESELAGADGDMTKSRSVLMQAAAAALDLQRRRKVPVQRGLYLEEDERKEVRACVWFQEFAAIAGLGLCFTYQSWYQKLLGFAGAGICRCNGCAGWQRSFVLEYWNAATKRKSCIKTWRNL